MHLDLSLSITVHLFIYHIKRDFYSDVYIILSRDLINNMDHMRISGTQPSSVILSQTK